MVWNTTQSSLYKAVSDYNDEIARRECHARQEPPTECHSEESCASPNSDPKSGPRQTPHCQKCANCSKYHTPQKGNTPMPGNLNIDSDFLLLAGLIFILYKNGADKKLILALAIALLG